MFVALQGPFRIMLFFTKNTFCDGITRVDVPCAEHVAFHARKNACYQFKKKVHSWPKPIKCVQKSRKYIKNNLPLKKEEKQKNIPGNHQFYHRP